MKTVLKKSILGLVSVAVISSLGGCVQRTSSDIDLKDSIDQKDIEVAQLQTTISNSEMFPPSAKNGECYTRVLTPEKFVMKKEKVLVSEASTKLIKVPAKYRLVNKKVLVSEASSRLLSSTPIYKVVKEKVLVKPVTNRLVAVPAVYQNKKVKKLVSASHTEWKRGSDKYSNILKQKTNATGEIICLVKVPAKYKIVNQRVLVKEATTRTISAPAQYKMIEKRVLVKTAATKSIAIPAKYKSIKVKELVSAATTKEVAITSKYKIINKKVKVSDSKLSWQAVLCKTNFTKPRVKMVQRALRAKGFNPGPIDGVVGRKTRSAMTRFQKTNSLASGAFTIRTLRALGVYK